MLPRLGFLLVGLMLAYAAPEFAAAQKDRPKANEPLVRLGELTATLTEVEASQKHLSVQYTQRALVPDPQAAAQNSAELLRRQVEIMQNPDPIARRQAMVQLVAEHQRNQSTAVQVQEVPVDLDLQATDDLKVRLLQPPPVFDVRGKPRAYTAKELKGLKGPDPKQPGYTGEFSSLKPGQTVLVTLAQRKDLLKKPAPKGKAVVPMPKKVDDPTVPKERLIVTRVVVLAEPAPQP